MKKIERSALFMGGYLLFLIVTFFYVLFGRLNENTVNENTIRILISVSISSCFFSISDLFTGISYRKEKSRNYLHSVLLSQESQVTRYMEIAKTLNRDLYNCFTNALSGIQSQITDNNEPFKNEFLFRKIGTSLYFIGTFSLCLLLGFTEISTYIIPYLELFTLLAFVCVITNYLISEIESKNFKERKTGIEQKLLLLNGTFAETDKMISGLLESYNAFISDENIIGNELKGARKENAVNDDC
jgi:hypothetical protein